MTRVFCYTLENYNLKCVIISNQIHTIEQNMAHISIKAMNKMNIKINININIKFVIATNVGY